MREGKKKQLGARSGRLVSSVHFCENVNRRTLARPSVVRSCTVLNIVLLSRTVFENQQCRFGH